jgi:hypothetical protein
MSLAGGYRIIRRVPSSVGRFTIWAYEPLQQAGSDHGRR